jgi:hypothetical protein
LFLLLLLLPIFPGAMRGFCEIRIPWHHYLIECIGLNGEIPTHFGGMIVWNGDDVSDRIFNTRDGFMSKDVRVGTIKGVAALVKEGQPMIDVKFQSMSVGANRKVLKM